MSRLNKVFAHSLGKEEATRRIRERISSEKINKASIATVTKEVWNGSDSLDFAMTVFNYRIDGSLKITESEVVLDMNLPIGAMVFKGMIESQLSQQMNVMLG